MPAFLSRRAFLRRPDPEPTGPRIAEVAASCLSINGTICGSCADPCEPRALRIRPLPGGRALPVIDPVLCTGCGACLEVCAVRALSLTPLPTETSACA